MRNNTKNGTVDFLRERKFPILYALLCIHWVAFFQIGNIDYYAYDWYCIHQWVDVLKLSLAEGKMPYEAQLWVPGSPGSQLFGQRFFAIPFLTLSPQFLLLKWVSVTTFIIIQVLLTFSVGFYFLVRWCKKLQLSDMTSYFLIFAWTLNGALIGRMGVGHIQLAGYFLIPGFIYLLHKLITAEKPVKALHGFIILSIPLALYLFFVLLQGTIFAAYQMALILVITAVFFFRRAKYILLSLAMFFLLASYFIYPNLVFGEYANPDGALRIVYGGYSGDGLFLFIQRNYQEHFSASVNDFLHKLQGMSGYALLKIPLNLVWAVVHILLALIVPLYPFQDAAWEYSVFIGPVGFLILLAGLYYYFSLVRKNKVKFDVKAGMVVFIIFLLSIWVFSKLMFDLVQKLVPINAIDRLPTRLFLYPLFVLLLISCIGLESSRLLKKIRESLVLKILMFISFVLPLLYNSYQWSSSQIGKASIMLEKTGRADKPAFGTKILDSVNASYVYTVNLSLLVSFLSLVVISIIYIYFKKKISKYDHVS